MDEPEIVISNTPEKNGFFSYVFNFDSENKNAIFNMLQYGALSIIPVILTLRLIKSTIPEDDETKGSLEITFEVIAQLTVLILAIWYTNKIIRYIPTYTGSPYSSFSETSAIIPFIIILITMQTKLGAKVNLLVDRATEYIRGSNGTPAPPQQQQQHHHISPPDNLPQYQNNNPPQQSDGYDVLKLLPSNKQLTAMPENISNMSNSSGNSRNQTTVTTALNEPTASNEGGGGWSAW